MTAGNASGVNDGAAAVIVASAGAVERFRLTPLARIAGMATAGVAPRIMGIGPVAATGRLLARLGRGIEDFGVIELNEAFAAQALACLRQLGVSDDAEHVNPNGGALTAAIEMGRSDAALGLCTMCIGVGQGIALALERA